MVSLHAPPFGELLLTQSTEHRKLVGPLVECTVWKPPALVNVTVSPALIVRVFGVKVRFELAVTA